MKKIIILFLLLFTLPLYACNQGGSDLSTPPVVDITPLPDIPTDEEENEDASKKKSYIVSTVNGLRIRKSANSSSTILGYLDKNDALFLIEKQGNFYKTIYKEQTAFVHASYCTIMDIETSIDAVEKAIDIGATLLGHPYVWGSQRYHWGNGVLNKNFVAGEFDCSALVQYVYYKSNKILLDVTSRAQSNNGVEVNRSELKRGDLMFFTNASRKNKTGVERIGHVAIYFGNNYILHTATDHAVIEPISTVRWSYYITSRRVV